MTRGRWFPVLAVVLLVVGPAVALDRTSLARAQATTAKGEEFLAKEDFARAEKLFREAIAIEPVLPSSHLGLGAALVGRQRFDEALKALQEAEGRYVRFEQEQQQAELSAKQLADQDQQAFKDLQQAQQGGAPAAVGTQGGSGGGHSYSDFTADRLATQEILVQNRWKMEEFRAIPAQVFYLEGISYLRSGRRSEGINALELALSIDPKHGLAHYNLAVALFSGGDAARAKEHLDAAVAAGVKPNPKFVADLKRARHT